MDIRIIGG